jgi:hypothetical protein
VWASVQPALSRYFDASPAIGDQRRLQSTVSQPVAKATGCEDTESSFPARDTEQRKLAHISVVSDTRGEFSVFSQAVRSFTRPASQCWQRLVHGRPVV